MKNYKYIEKVLSHIKSKKNRASVEAELFDHIDERSKYYMELGYDDEQASERAEHIMGDGDVVGEQLDLQLRTKRAVRPLLLLADVIALALNIILFVVSWYIADYSFPTYYCVSRFVIFVLSVFALGICFVCLAQATEHKSLLSVFTGTLLSVIPTIEVSSGIASVIYGVFTGQPIALPFYMAVCEPAEFMSNLVALVIFTVVAAAFFNCLIVYIKTKRLENTRADIIQCKVIRCILVIAIAVLFLFALVASVSVVDYREKALANAIATSDKAAHSIIDNVDKLMTDDSEEILSAIEECFDEGECNTDHILCESYDFDSFYPADADLDELTNTLVITTSQYIESPFAVGNEDYSIDYRYKLTSDDVFSGMTIYDAPLPADIRFEYNKNECTIEFNYYGDASYILFTYNFKSKVFELTDSTEFSYDKSVKLTEKQKSLLDKEVFEYINDYDMTSMYTLVYDTACDSKCNADNIYKIDFAYCIYSVVEDGGKLKFAEKSVEEELTALVRVGDDSVTIISLLNISTQYDKSDEYLRRFFTSKGYERYMNRNPEWYNAVLKEN